VTSTLVSSAVVGVVSSPGYAVFNGQTQGWGMRESLRKFSMQQAAAISARETALVFGLSAGDKFATAAKNRFGDRKSVALFTLSGKIFGHLKPRTCSKKG
jgi:hypothetical protein